MKTRIDAIIELTKLGWTAEEIKAAFDTPTEERIIIQPMPYPIYQPRRWHEWPYWPYYSYPNNYPIGTTTVSSGTAYQDGNGNWVVMADVGDGQ